MCSVFAINPNRLVRYQATSGKRLDFQFQVNGSLYMHEVKGTSYRSKVKGLVRNITAQKAAGFAGVRALSATVTVFEQENRRDDGTEVVLLDPPADGLGVRVGPNDELVSLLVYYRNILTLTHSGNGDEWLASVITGLRAGGDLPVAPPEDLVMAGRVREPGPGRDGGDYRGTIFDRRTLASSVAEYETFEAATEAIARPVFFYGLAQAVVDMIRRCRWDGLLAFSDANAVDEDREGRLVLASGTVATDLSGDGADEFEDSARNAFGVLRRAYERARGAR